MSNLKAAGYCRVSSAEQRDHGWNLQADRERIAAIAEERAWQLVEIFDDGGRQGDDPDRPGFNALLARLDEFNVIILRSLDRLSRDVYLYALAAKSIRTAGVAVESFNGPVDLQTPEGELASNVLAAIHRFEKRQIGARVKQALTARARSGLYNGGPSPYGYVQDGGRLLIDPAQAEVVRRIFQMADSGVSQRAIATRLREEGIAKEQSSVGQILRSPLYKGFVRVPAEGRYLRAQHEPIVEEALWDRVNAARSSTRRTGGRPPKGSHLLTKGVLRCGRCGSAMIASSGGRQGYRHDAYICRGRRLYGAKFCTQSAVSRKAIDESILRELTNRYLDLEVTKHRIAERQSADLTVAKDLTAQAERALATAEARIERVRRAFQDGYLEPSDYADQIRELNSEREAASQAASQALRRCKELEAGGPLLDAEAALLDVLKRLREAVADGVANAPDLNALRTIIRQLFESVELVSRELPFGSGKTRGGHLDAHGDQDLKAGEYRLFVRLRNEAFDFTKYRPRRLSLPVQTDQSDLASRSISPDVLFGPIYVAMEVDQ